MGVLAALFDRTRTGRGQKIEVVMLRAALDLQLEVLTYYLNGGQMRKSATGLASMVHPGPCGVYQTKDSYLVLSSAPLSALQAALQLPELGPIAKKRYNFRHREQIAQILEPVIRTRTTAEWLEYLVPRGVWAAPVLTYDELFAHPVAQSADVTEEVDHPVAGHVRLLRFPLEFSSGRAGVRRHPPASGEHTDEILQELGYTQEERAHFRHGKVVGGQTVQREPLCKVAERASTAMPSEIRRDAPRPSRKPMRRCSAPSLGTSTRSTLTRSWVRRTRFGG